MTKGIREFTSSRFMKLLPRARDMGPRGFRRRVMDDVIKQFDISVASAATAYNYVLKTMREQDPKAVDGIGRGFQPTQQGDAAPAAPVAAKRGPGRPPKVAAGPANARRASDAQPAAAQPPGDMVTVVKARDGAVVAQAIDRKLARDLVAASSGRGRPKLVIKEDEEELDAA